MRYSEADRKRRGKRRKKHYFLNFLITVLVIAGLYFLAFHSGVFDIKTIAVTSGGGGSHYTAAQVGELSGVLKGDNLFKTRVSAVEEKLERDPYIRDAEVSWNLPDGLDITIDERRESLLVAYAEGYAVVDYDGMILRLTEDSQALPVIAGLTPVEPKPGVALKAEEAGQLKPGLDFIKYVDEHDFYIKKLDLGGVIPRAYVFDLLAVEGDFKNIEKNIEEIKRIVAYQDSQGVKRGTISVGSTSCTFSPEIPGAGAQ